MENLLALHQGLHEEVLMYLNLTRIFLFELLFLHPGLQKLLLSMDDFSWL